MSALHVVLPLPVGVNSTGSGARRKPGTYQPIIRRRMNGTLYPSLSLSESARQWKEDAVLLVSVKARTEGWTAPDGRLRLAVLRSDGHDLDSGVKLLCDAVATGLGIDDARFAQILLTRAESCRRDCLLVIVEGMDG